MAITYENTPLSWANKGTEPPAALKQAGWQPAQKPPSAYFNYQFANTGDCLTELQNKLSAHASTVESEIDTLENRVTPINLGGTGATTVSEALTNLGLEDTVHTANDTTAPSTETPIDADLLEGHSASYFATADSAATATTYTATLTTTWTGSSAPYTQTVTITGITSSDTPIVDVILSSTTSTALSQLEAWGCVSKIETATDSITVTCLEDKPITAIPIQLKVVR